MTRHHRSAGKSDGGFTLIELLTTITIIGILAGIAVLSTQTFRKKSVTQACVTDVRTDQLALDVYKTKFGLYPDTQAKLTSAGVINRLYDGTSYTITYLPGPAPFTTYTLSVEVGTQAPLTVQPGSSRVENLAACASA